MKALRLPTPHPGRFWFATGFRAVLRGSCSPKRSRADGGAARAWAVWSAGGPVPAGVRVDGAGSHRFPGDPSRAFALVQDPGRISGPSPKRSHRCCPRAQHNEGFGGHMIARKGFRALSRHPPVQGLPCASWVHAERLVHKLNTFTDHQHRTQQHLRALIWWFYRDLKAYRREPTPRRRSELRARFDRIFKRQTGFVLLDCLLARLHANKAELLRVLERPEIPLHTNGSENDIRCYVTRRKISGSTRSDQGRDSRDTFLGLMKTCQKLGVSFWAYLGARLAIPKTPAVPPLPDLIRARCAIA